MVKTYVSPYTPKPQDLTPAENIRRTRAGCKPKKAVGFNRGLWKPKGYLPPAIKL